MKNLSTITRNTEPRVNPGPWTTFVGYSKLSGFLGGRNGQYLILLLSLRAVSFAIHPVLGAAASPGSPHAMVAMVANRLLKLRNLVVRYDKDIDYTPSRAVEAFTRKAVEAIVRKHPGMKAGSPMLGHYLYRCQLSVLGERVRYEVTAATAKAVGGPLGVKTEIQTSIPGRVETFIPPRLGTIRVRAAPVDSMLMSAALGLRAQSGKHWFWIRKGDLKKMAFSGLRRGRFSLTEAVPSGQKYEWIFKKNPALELVGIKVIIDVPPNPAYLWIRVKCSDFVNVGGLRLPDRVHESEFAGPRFPGRMRSELLTRIRYSIGPASNVPQAYFILWPKGCVVLDERIDRVFHIKKPTILSDKEIFMRLKKIDGHTVR